MKKLIFALLAGTTAMGAAQAQTMVQNVVQNGYVGVGVAAVDQDFSAGPASSSAGYKAAGKIFAGYDINPMWAVEAGYTNLRKAQGNYNVGPLNYGTEVDGRRTYVAAKASVPVNEAFSVYGKLGAGYSKAELSTAAPGGSRSESDTELYGAIGGQMNLSKQVALTLEYERYGKKKDFGPKPDAITIAARYSF